jgi:hypothetical protein
MVRKRKRAPGGGRKSQGPISGKTHVFTTRISAETREALDREATLSGQSLSQVAEVLIRAGLNRRRELDRDRPMRALCFLIAELAKFLSLDRSLSSKKSISFGKADETYWRTNPFVFKALQAAIPLAMQEFAPDGPVVPPEAFKKHHKYLGKKPPQTPEEWAADMTDWLMFAMINLQRPRRSILPGVRGDEWAAKFDTWIYGLFDAGKDLGINQSEDGDSK